MQLTIDIKDSAIDKVMYLLENLKSDIKILSKPKTLDLDIETITQDDEDYIYILNGKKDRVKNPQNYGTLDDISSQ